MDRLKEDQDIMVAMKWKKSVLMLKMSCYKHGKNRSSTLRAKERERIERKRKQMIMMSIILLLVSV